MEGVAPRPKPLSFLLSRYYRNAYFFAFFWACLHGVGAPPEGEVTRLGGLTLLSIYVLSGAR